MAAAATTTTLVAAAAAVAADPKAAAGGGGGSSSSNGRRVFVINGLLGLAFASYLSSRGLRKGSLSRSGALAVRV
jgi:hypothetical protein